MPAHAPIACCGLVPAGNWQPTGRMPIRTRGASARSLRAWAARPTPGTVQAAGPM